MERLELYFPRDIEWREWLEIHHASHPKGVDLIFYKLESKIPTMRWEEAVRVALCFGWIDSTVKNMGGPKRRQFFCPRNPKSTWSALNKKYIAELEPQGLIHESGWKLIREAKKSGTWTLMDGPDKGIIPPLLKDAFSKNQKAFEFYKSLTPGYQKSHLRWLATAKTEPTIIKRVAEIISMCNEEIKSRS